MQNNALILYNGIGSMNKLELEKSAKCDAARFTLDAGDVKCVDQKGIERVYHTWETPRDPDYGDSEYVEFNNCIDCGLKARSVYKLTALFVGHAIGESIYENDEDMPTFEDWEDRMANMNISEGDYSHMYDCVLVEAEIMIETDMKLQKWKYELLAKLFEIKYGKPMPASMFEGEVEE